jgi:hypothetical protein
VGYPKGRQATSRAWLALAWCCGAYQCAAPEVVGALVSRVISVLPVPDPIPRPVAALLYQDVSHCHACHACHMCSLAHTHTLPCVVRLPGPARPRPRLPACHRIDKIVAHCRTQVTCVGLRTHIGMRRAPSRPQPYPTPTPSFRHTARQKLRPRHRAQLVPLAHLCSA